MISRFLKYQTRFVQK